jgi:putative sigma-54 modulation protein
MNINIKGTHVDLTESIKEYIEEKIGHLEKYIQAQEAHVELARDTHHHTGLVFHADINLILGSKIMHANAEAEDAYAAIDLLIPKLKEQIGKFKDKRQTLTRRGARSAKSRR